MIELCIGRTESAMQGQAPHNKLHIHLVSPHYKYLHTCSILYYSILVHVLYTILLTMAYLYVLLVQPVHQSIQEPGHLAPHTLKLLRLHVRRVQPIRQLMSESERERELS